MKQRYLIKKLESIGFKFEIKKSMKNLQEQY